jgi:hypothetical protein
MRTSRPARAALRCRAVLLLVRAVAVPSFAPHATAAPSPVGLLCGFTERDNPPARLRHKVLVSAGPVLLTDDADPVAGLSGSVTCSLQIDAGTHDAPDVAAITGPTTARVAALAGEVEYVRAGYDYDLWYCTRVDLTDGTTLYYDEGDAVDDGGWSTDPATSSCALAYASAVPRPSCDWVCGSCAVLGVAFPPDGEVPGVWDCPPYHS